eukprot:4433128-Pleurochrysis_carterae.AAC.1
MGGIPDGHSVKTHSGAGGRGKRFAQHQRLVRLNVSNLNAASCECADQGSGSTGKSFVLQARGAKIENQHHQKTCWPPTLVAVLHTLPGKCLVGNKRTEWRPLKLLVNPFDHTLPPDRTACVCAG